jgi:hypothetical protein
MSETWIPWAIKSPGDQTKFGYPPGTKRTLDKILYIVNHSGEGGINYLKQGHRPNEEASWMFSNALDGTLYQHYPLEAPTWTSGGPAQNIAGIGVEHEGVGPTKFTDAQADTDVRLYLELKKFCPNLRAPVLGQGLETHKRLAPGTTSCPNSRDRYDKYNAIGQEEPMSDAQIDARITALMQGAPKVAEGGYIRAKGQDEVYIVLGGQRRWLNSQKSQRRGVGTARKLRCTPFSSWRGQRGRASTLRDNRRTGSANGDRVVAHAIDVAGEHRRRR